MKKKWLKAVFFILFCIVAGLAYSCNIADNKDDEKGSLIIEDNDDEESNDFFESTDEISETSIVCVYVCGCVNSPGIFYLSEGSRLFEAVEMAGGLSENAASEALNLAEIVSDGQKIFIPSSADIRDTDHVQEPTDGKVNINTAGVDELITLPGIGNTRAEAIITYREQQGAFKDISEITNVSGIGKASFEKLKDRIRV